MPASLRDLRRVPAATTLAAFSIVLLGQTPPVPKTSAPATPARPAFVPTPEMLAIQAASEKDHQRVMDELGIKQLRPGVDSDPASPHAANYDESKANVYPNLPDVLRLNNGKPVTSPKMWWDDRRPEIVELYDREIL